MGVARSLNDFAYVTYLSDLLVRETHHRLGIGRRLLEETRAAAPRASVVLLSAPGTRAYYPRLGMEPHPSAWTLQPGRPLSPPQNPAAPAGA